MLIIRYIVLAVIQGFTEPLPISSSGHLMIFKHLFNSNVINDINFEIVVNFGSLIGIIFLYKKELSTLIKDFFMYIKTKNKKYKINYKYSWLIVIGTIPPCIIGLFLKDFIENNFTIKLLSLMFIMTSLLLYMVQDIKGKKDKKDITYIDAVKIGLFQALALFPGISRSGATIVGCMKSNLKRETALDYSFMLYIPISIAALILSIKDLINIENYLLIPYFISIVISSIVTYYSAKLFIDIIKKGKLIYFSIYCFTLGIIILLFI